MIFGIAGFEIRYQLRNPVFWVSALIFLLLGFGLTASENVSIGTPGSVHENAPFAIASAMSLLSLFYLFVITSFVSNAIVRDDATGYGPIIRTTSITKRDLVIGRFLGGLTIALLGFLAVPLGMGLGVNMPWVDPETVGPGGLTVYAWHYFVLAAPNVFFASAFLFGLATTLRSMMATYIGVVVFVLGYFIALNILGPKPEYQDILSRYEPLGFGAIMDVTRYWTAAEMNTKLLPFAGNVLFNRVLVLLLGTAMLALTYVRFSMSERAPSSGKLRRLAKAQAAEAQAASIVPRGGGEDIYPEYGSMTTRAQLSARLKTEVMQVLKSPGLIVLILLAVVQTGVILAFSETLYGAPSHPLIADIATNVRDGFALFMLIVAVFYGGELVWRERDRKINEIIDSTPVPSWVMILPKIVAILVVLMCMTLSGMAMGMGYALIKGSETLGFGQFLAWLVIPQTLDVMQLAILAVFAQVISPNKYVGWGIVFVWFISDIFLRNMGYQNMLYRYGGGPLEPLSDMNGAGGFWVGAMWGRFYWGAFGLLLMVIAHLVWPRGTEVALRPRLANMRRRLTGGPLVLSVAALVAMVGSGLFIYDNIKRLNTYRTADDQEKWAADYEKRYLKYETLPRPVVTFAKFDAQVFPQERRLDVTGSYSLRNDTNAPISEVHVRAGDIDTEFRKLDLAGAKLATFDKAFGYRIFRFDQPLQPGQTSALNFQTRMWRRGFRNGAPATDVVENGTFVNNFEFGPIIGMNRQGSLQDRTKRRRQGLSSELRPAKLEDTSAQARNYLNVDWLQSDITVTTDSDQTPIAPGKRVSENMVNGRRTARFVSTAPILNFFAIQSARYAVAEQEHNGINLAVYYHAPHKWNVPIILKALETSHDYYTQNFGPYQFDYARIIEFPGYQSFAQAFAGSMPYSESIGFAADVRDPETIDYVSYVTAHEFGHQYWAHQVVGADMQGGTLTSETLAQYSALRVMKRLYGPDKIRRFLKYELDNYLGSRKGEAVEELPMLRVENQGYIHYRKGSLVMYLLAERLGEDAVNRALSRFLQRFKFKGAPYHRSVDLIAEFRKEARTPAQQALITDLFEKITVYDFKVKEAKSVRGADGLWSTTLTVEAKKFYADGKGVEKETALDEPIEVGLFTARPGIGAFSKADVIQMIQNPIKSGQQTITLKSKAKPTFAGVDPYNFYIDRDSDDNVKDVTQ
jgi:ABC-type transport system involved in multi-copper enzyme maturation permease subunit